MYNINSRFVYLVFATLLIQAACTNPDQKRAELKTIPHSVLRFNAEHSEFGQYYRGMFESIERKWRKLLKEEKIAPGNIEDFTASFSVYADGRVDMLKVEKSGVSEALIEIAIRSIKESAPFQPWTGEMEERIREPLSLKIVFDFK